MKVRQDLLAGASGYYREKCLHPAQNLSPHLPPAVICDPHPPAEARRLSAGRRLRGLSLPRRCEPLVV
jgi:hypothetical protein